MTRYFIELRMYSGSPLQLSSLGSLCQSHPAKLPQASCPRNRRPGSHPPAGQVSVLRSRFLLAWLNLHSSRLRGRPPPRSPLALPLTLASFGLLARASLCSLRWLVGKDLPESAALAGAIAGLASTFYRFDQH